MKKLYLILFLALFLVVPMVSALRVSYEANDLQVDDMKVVISDTILFGLIKTGEQGTMELKSHSTPDEVIRVGAGWQVTMIYDMYFNDAYTDGLGKVYFYDMRTKQEVERDYKFVYWGTENRTKQVCTSSIVDNSTKTLETKTLIAEPLCVNQNYVYEGWLDYNSKDIPKGQIRLGLMTYVLPNDIVDGIWTIQGKEITRHAEWTADLNTGLRTYYKFDEGSGVVIDSTGNANATANGVTNTTGKINSAYAYGGSGDNINTSLAVLNAFSYSAWIYMDNLPSGTDYQAMIASNNFQTWVGVRGTGLIRFHLNSGSYYLDTNTGIVTADNWHHIVATWDGTNAKIYLNNVSVGISTSGSPTNPAFGFAMWGKDPTGGNDFVGIIDEGGIWNRSLSQEEVTQLYNGGNGISYTDSFGAVTSLSPVGSTTSTNPTITFIGNTTQTDVANFSLIVNDTYEQTNTSGLSGNYSFTETLDDGVYSWKFEGCNILNECLNSTARTLTIDTTPFIEFVSPTPDNASNLSTPYIPVNVTLTETYFENVTFNFYKGGFLNESVTFTNDTRFYNKTGCTCDNWEINVTTCTTTGQCNSTETRVLYIDILAPEINVVSPNETFDYLYVGKSLDLNFTVTDASSHLDSCWWNYNGTNYTESCSDGVQFNTTILQEANNFNLTVYANDTFGNENSEFVSWDYKVFENSVTYNNETIEGNTEDFILNITLGTGYSLSSGVLHYNGETDTSSIFSSGSNASVQSDLFIENVVGDTNKTFYWVLTLADSSTVNTRNYTQLVTDLLFDNCTTQPNRLFTLFLKDEELKTALNGTIEVNLEILNPINYGMITNITAKYENISEQSFCTNVNFSATSFLLDAEIRYSATNYSAEFYHIQRAALSGYPVNISLFDLKDADTTVFKVNYRGTDLIGVEGAIVQLQRKYIDEGIYEVVEAPLTSSESSTVLHIDTKTNKYQVTVVKNGVVLGVFENLVFVCESELTGECTLNLFDAIIPENTEEITALQDFSYSISTVNNTITTSFTIPSGTPTEVQVVVYQDTIVGRTEICNTTLTSSAGSIDCVYTDSIEDSVLDLRIYKSDALIAQKGYLARDDLTDSWNGDNYFIVIIFMLSLVFMAITSPEMIIIVSIITMLFAGGVWLLNGLDFVTGIGTLVWLILAAIILIMKLSKQEDR